jgi:putative oxidoreductase
MNDTASSAALLAIRLVVGFAFVLHGWPKIHNPLAWMGAQSPVPGIFQALAAVSEFAGGIAWILGALTPLAAAGIACTMAVAVVRHAFIRHDPFVDRGGSSFELAAAYFCVALLLLLAGPGKFSVDRILSAR